MKEYLKPYLLPKEYAGKPYKCSICKGDIIIQSDSKSGNRRTFSLCRKCKTNLGRIDKYGSLENFKKIYRENLSRACKEKWKDENYKNNISEKVKENWKKEGYKERVSNSLKENWRAQDKSKRKEILQKSMSSFFSSKKNEVLNFKNQLEKIKNERFFSLTEAVREFEICDTTIERVSKKLNINPIKKFNCTFYSESQLKEISKNVGFTGSSDEEKEILNFVKSIYKGTILENNREVLEGCELDIFIPERKLAIEYNGLYWHSDICNLKKGEIPDEEKRCLSKERHLEKTKLCEERGIRLIHIFSDDWNFQNEKVKNLIQIALGIVKTKIYARKCILKKLSNEDYKEFLNKYHLQNYSPADLRLGLYYEGDLVELVGIKTKGNHSKEPELVRLCSKQEVSVIGGFSKLLKHSGIETIVSYIDRSTFSGEGYFKAGFEKILENRPTYFYTKGTLREPRYHYMRKGIERKFKEGILQYWNSEETEELNMYKNGYGRIWNCGTIKVKWVRS